MVLAMISTVIAQLNAYDMSFVALEFAELCVYVLQLGGTTLNLAKAPKHYDGRYIGKQWHTLCLKKSITRPFQCIC